MKQFLTAILVLMLNSSCARTKATRGGTFNPTGSYSLDLVYKIKDGDKFGYFGSIKLKRVIDSTLAMSFFVSKGAPGYNSRSFVDTVSYKGNNVIQYTPYKVDSSCVLTFKFVPKGIMVYQEAVDINNACGFGHGVAANDLFYKRISTKTPIIQDPLTE